jgi:shikimate dehydrogenase
MQGYTKGSWVMLDNYAVFGNPVEHSKSPDIHTAFAKANDEKISYKRQHIDIGAFEKEAQKFFKSGGKGLNVTLPFKLDAYNFAENLTQRAKIAGAVNTLSVGYDGKIQGDTTDGIGITRDIVDNLGWAINGKKVLVLGAGGAVRGILQPILELLPQNVVIANRTIEKALKLSKIFADMGNLLGCDFQMLGGQQFDVVINGTSATLSNKIPPLPRGLLSKNAVCYEMMYGSQQSIFLEWAKNNGAAQISDGLGMLVEQAAESFYVWRGVRPETRAVISMLKKQISLL